VGELRGRAARMEPIKDLSELTPTLNSLQSKGLIVYLTPPGRGSVITHALYLDREMEKVRRESGAAPAAAAMPGTQGEPADTFQAATTSPADAADAASLVEQLNSLRDELAAVKREFDATRSDFTATAEELRRELDELNRQLGN
jgi:hypothetical protein